MAEQKRHMGSAERFWKAFPQAIPVTYARPENNEKSDL